MSNKVGLFKRLLVNFYDLILLFAVLYFFTIPIIYTFIIIVFDVHIDDPFSKMEKGILFLSSYLLIFGLGPGKLSVDNLTAKK